MEYSDLTTYIVDKVPPVIYYIPNFITEEEETYLTRKVYEAPKPKWTELSKRRLQNWGGIPHPKGMIPDEIPKWLQVHCDKVVELGIFEDCKPNHILINEYRPGQGIMPHTDGPLYYPTVANITLNSHGVLDLYHPIDRGPADGADAPTDSKKGSADGKDLQVDGKEDPADSKEGPVGNKESQLQYQQHTSSTALEDRHFGSILLERRSLIIVQKDMYSNYLHGIRETSTDIMTDKIANLERCPTRRRGQELPRDTRVSLTIRNVPKVIKARFLLGKRR